MPKKWQLSTGMGGNFSPEWWQLKNGIGGIFAPEYALQIKGETSGLCRVINIKLAVQQTYNQFYVCSMLLIRVLLINWQLTFYVVVGSLCLRLKDNHNCNTLGKNMIEIGYTRHNQALDIMSKCMKSNMFGDT
ncbi:hypothetical protein ES703_106254 [subsurface metagenome]